MTGTTSTALIHEIRQSICELLSTDQFAMKIPALVVERLVEELSIISMTTLTKMLDHIHANPKKLASRAYSLWRKQILTISALFCQESELTMQ